MQHDSKSTHNQSLWRICLRLSAFVKPYWGWVIISIVAALTSAGTDVAAGYFIKTITDAVGAIMTTPAIGAEQSRLLQTLFPQISLMLAVVVLGTFASYGVKYTTGRFSTLALRDLRARATANLGRVPLTVIETRHSGDWVSRLNQDAGLVQGFLQSGFTDLVYQPVLFLAAFTYMLILDWRLLLVMALVEPAAILLGNFLSRPLEGYTRTESEGFAKMYALAEDAIGGITMSKAFNLEQPLYERFKAAVDQLLYGRLQFEKRSAKMMPLFFFIQVVPRLSIAGVGGYLAIKGELTPGSLFAFVYLSGFLIRPLLVIPDLLAELRRMTAGAKRLFAVLDEPPERTNGTMFQVNHEKPAIICSGLTYAYPEQACVINNLHFEIATGQTVAIVGHSGSGKSTLFKLLCGFYTPQAGRLALYGHDYDQWNLKKLRTHFSLVEQDTYLFPTTIGENIGYGRLMPDNVSKASNHGGTTTATMDEITAAAQAAHAHDFIMTLPEGYQTLVGERGMRLSGGERQRIGIARAILKDAPILLLDEPTSALDTESEAVVQRALERLMVGKTTLVIAHRLSTIQQADEIFVLDQRAIAERGTHKQLLNSGGLYCQLYQKQFQR
ncbi:ABC transporter ATP-binding protein/permease [Chloroflexi bacterium TSY]|nr:ABC transporter ATP-binding protein/permease [Chloroflexi bacterium TSY]